MKKIAFLFPGQGSQTVGMGQEFYQAYDFVKEIFEMAEDVSKLPLMRLCFQGPMEALTETVNLQPALTAVNLACLAAVASEGIQPAVTAGHSLGEFSALFASGIIARQDAFFLVFNRGKLMHRDSLKHKGGMAAILGLPLDTVRQLVETVSEKGVVSVANHNSEHQIVVTGVPELVEEVSGLAREKGGKGVSLKVSGAWHSELIRDAEKDFQSVLNQIDFNLPRCPVVHNVTADFSPETPDQIRKIVGKQLCRPVRWFDSMKKLEQERVEIFVEIGPGKVLTGLLKKILPREYPGEIFNVHDLKSMEIFLKRCA